MTSTVPTRSSIVRNAITLLFFVYLIVLLDIMPPIVSFAPSLTLACPLSSSSWKSSVVRVTFFCHLSLYSSIGCPVRYTPSTSFSRANFSPVSYSPTSGSATSNSVFSSSLTRSNSDICPVMDDFRSRFIWSNSCG